MQAIVQDSYGTQEELTLRDIDRPAIGDGEVLVRVQAASIHLGDWILMTGSPFVMRLATGLRKPKNRVPGTDLAGVVEAVGKDIQRLRRVRAGNRGPAHQQAGQPHLRSGGRGRRVRIDGPPASPR